LNFEQDDPKHFILDSTLNILSSTLCPQGYVAEALGQRVISQRFYFVYAWEGVGIKKLRLIVVSSETLETISAWPKEKKKNQVAILPKKRD